MSKMEVASRNAAAIAAWKRALQRCLSTRSHGVIDESVVLVYVDSPRVFHPVQALVNDAIADDDATTPLILVSKLHPQLSALLQKLTDEGKASDEDVAVIMESLLFQEQHMRTTISSSADHSAIVAPFFADKRLNVDGGALNLYGATQQTASQALSMLTLAILGGENVENDRIVADFERFVAVVEHADGYLGREFVLNAPESGPASPPRLFRIQKREWSSSAVAQLSLDDALEAFEAAYLEEQEINKNGGDISPPSSLHIGVEAAFEVRDLSRRTHGSLFLLDSDEDSRQSSSGVTLPPVVLFSQWQGLENVRSLLCKPPPQSASTLCFSIATDASRVSGNGIQVGSHQGITLLRHLDEAIPVHDGSSSCRSWQTNTDLGIIEGEILAKFKRFLKNIDQDESSDGAGDDNTNTIESSISLVLDGEGDHSQAGASRAGLDPVEKLWDFLTRYADSADTVQKIVQDFVVHLSNTRIFPAAHPENDTQLAKLMRLRVDEIQGTAASPLEFTTSAQQLLAQPSDVLAFVVEAGEWKMKRDVAFWLAQTGFSSQECVEFVQAMPRFNSHSRDASRTQWTAMDHVLQLCCAGSSIHLPVSYMRKAVHDCIGFYARGDAIVDHDTPSILIDLQSFIPDRLRANVADPLYWDLRIAFDSSYEHRVRICQDSFHSTAKGSSSTDVILDDATLHALHRNTPDALKQHSEMIQFMTKLEDDREKRLYEQLHDIDMPTGMTRYDCTMRTLHGLT